MPGIGNVIGFDDAPFDKAHRGDVPLVGTVWAKHRLDGVLYGRVRRDGRNSTNAIAELLLGSRFDDHVKCVLLQGITVAGFNVVDLEELHQRVGRPVIAVARHQPRRKLIRDALLTRVPGGARKWALIEKAGEMEPMAGVWVQRAGITPAKAEATVRLHATHGNLPEPLRMAHLLGAALVYGHSHGGA